MFSVWYGLALCSGAFGAFKGFDACVYETVAIETPYFMLVGKLLVLPQQWARRLLWSYDCSQMYYVSELF